MANVKVLVVNGDSSVNFDGIISLETAKKVINLCFEDLEAGDTSSNKLLAEHMLAATNKKSEALKEFLKPKEEVVKKAYPHRFSECSKSRITPRHDALWSAYEKVIGLLQSDKEITLSSAFDKIYKQSFNTYYKAQFKRYCDEKGLIADNYWNRKRCWKRQVKSDLILPKQVIHNA